MGFIVWDMLFVMMVFLLGAITSAVYSKIKGRRHKKVFLSKQLEKKRSII